MTPLDLAKSYSVFANMGKKQEVNPILKILDSDGLVIEEYNDKNKKEEQVIDSATAFIINSILSDTSARPSYWNTYLDLPDRSVAAKTGTSTK